MVHHPTCCASSHGIFILRKVPGPTPSVLLSLDFLMMSLMDPFKFWHVFCIRRFIGGPYPLHCHPSVCSVGLGFYLCQESLFIDIQGTGSLTPSIVEVSTAIAWRRASLVRLWRTLFFEIAFSLALLWSDLFTLSLSECTAHRGSSLDL